MNRDLERREMPQGVNLRLVPPQGDKYHMIGFEARTPREAHAYREVIGHYLEKLGKRYFFQITGNKDGVGYNGIEIWHRNLNEQEIEALFPRICRDAQILATENDLDARYEQVYKKWDQED